MELFRYQRDDGSEPFSEWLAQLDDRRAQANVRVRLLRLEAGNLGDASAVGEGVMELRIHVGAGYRVYFGRHGQAIVILLMGGSKKRQAADIRLAKQYWLEWKSTQS